MHQEKESSDAVPHFPEDLKCRDDTGKYLLKKVFTS